MVPAFLSERPVLDCFHVCPRPLKRIFQHRGRCQSVPSCCTAIDHTSAWKGHSHTTSMSNRRPRKQGFRAAMWRRGAPRSIVPQLRLYCGPGVRGLPRFSPSSFDLNSPPLAAPAKRTPSGEMARRELPCRQFHSRRQSIPDHGASSDTFPTERGNEGCPGRIYCDSHDIAVPSPVFSC